MKDNSERNIRIISGIEEEIIDRNTEKRIQYINGMNKRKKIKLAPIIAIAATVAILMSIALMIFAPMLTKQVPIYKGMTVTSADVQDVAKYDNVFKLSSLMPIDNENTEGNNGNHGSNNQNKKPMEEIVKDESSLQILGGKVIYSAKPGEKVLVVIHFDNPDQFEIMSFTLNGKKYATQMFKDGSDMENLIVEYDIDEDAEGIIDCTIDAIKYIDGTTIKDVKIGGDQTVQIGVYNKEQPTAKIENEVIGTTDVSFDVTLNDPLGLIALTNGKAFAVLTDGEELIESQELKTGEKQSVKFEELDPNKYYRYAIIAVYDAFDGKGAVAHTFYENPLNEYEISYVLDGGENSQNNPEFYKTNTSIAIEDPTKEGFVFLGWTYGSQTTPQKNLVISQGSRGNIELTAHWKVFKFEMNIVDGGKIVCDYAPNGVYNPYYNDYEPHNAIDIGASKGASVRAAFDGKIIDIYEDRIYGHCIVIEHPYGYRTMYCSLDGSHPQGIKIGASVTSGQVIAYVGDPPKSEEHLGYHVHFVAICNGETIDPKEHM